MQLICKSNFLGSNIVSTQKDNYILWHINETTQKIVEMLMLNILYIFVIFSLVNSWIHSHFQLVKELVYYRNRQLWLGFIFPSAQLNSCLWSLGPATDLSVCILAPHSFCPSFSNHLLMAPLQSVIVVFCLVLSEKHSLAVILLSLCNYKGSLVIIRSHFEEIGELLK